MPARSTEKKQLRRLQNLYVRLRKNYMATVAEKNMHCDLLFLFLALVQRIIEAGV